MEGPYVDVGPALTSAASFGGATKGAEGGHLGVDSFHPYTTAGGVVQALIGHTGLVPAALLHNFSYLGQCDDKPQPDRRRGEYYGNFGRVSAATPTSTWHWEQYSVANFDAYGCGPPDGSSGCNVVPTAAGAACQCGHYENPVVVPLGGEGYIATMDVVSPSNATDVSELVGFGWIYSPDGVAWEPAVHMVRIPGGSRTPLGLVPVTGEAARTLLPAGAALPRDGPGRAGSSVHVAVLYSSTSDHLPLKCCPPHGQTFPIYGAVLQVL